MCFCIGTSAWGLIKLAGSSICLFRRPHGPHPPFVSANNCPGGTSPDPNYMWKLDVNNHLMNEADSSKHVYFNYKPQPNKPSSMSRTIKINENNKQGDHCHTGPAHCDKLTFEYASTDYQYFQIKQRTRRDCIGWPRGGGNPYRESATIQVCGSVDSPVKHYTQSPTNYATWFTWEPLKQ